VVKLTEIILRSVADRGVGRTVDGARRYESLLYFPALTRGWLSRIRRSRCIRIWAASAEVLASAMARSKGLRGPRHSWPSWHQERAAHAEEVK